MELDHLALFLRIIEKGSMAAAGRELGLSPATVSDRLAALEAYYGTRLLRRTTRALHLTDEGQLLVEGARRLVCDAEELKSRISLGANQLSGRIRVTAPIDLGRNRISPILSAFKDRWPHVSIDLLLEDGYVDLVSSGVDLGIRYGDLPDSTLRVRKIGDNRRFVCAAPSYLEAYGVPTHPKDLVKHQAVLMRFGSTVEQNWTFLIDGKKFRVGMRSSRVANDGELIRHWCKAGHGLALKSIWDIADDLDSGALVSVLEDFSIPSGNLQIVMPEGKSHRTRMLVEFIVSKLTPPHKQSRFLRE